MAKARDIAGNKYGKLTAIKDTGERKNGFALWECLCECGNKKVIASANLIHGRTISCGCMREEINKKSTQTQKERYFKENSSVPALTKKVSKNSATQKKGVYHKKRRNVYEAWITFKGERKYLGTFANIEDAVKARAVAEEELYFPYLKKYDKREKHKK